MIREPKGPGRPIALAALLIVFMAGAPLVADDLRAGAARVKITPPTPFWMSGYAARTHPSEGVLQDLWARALAVSDGEGGRVVFVSTDLIGLSRAISTEVAAGARERFGLEPSELVLNSSHTHSGPLVWQNLPVLLDLDAEDERAVEAYGRELARKLVDVIGDALRGLAPARLAVGHGSVGFAVNRRVRTREGYRIGVNPDGPVDHDVPVLTVTAPDGSLVAVLFGYACHNTTLRGDFYLIGGDYAGQAQDELEQAHPGATALFVMLCGGDQNPHPRETLEWARRHGRTLAAEVSRLLEASLSPVRPPIRTAFEEIRLDFAPHAREVFEQEAEHSDPYRRRRARRMLAAYDRGSPVRQTPYPVQAVRFGRDLTFLALGGEVVVDYATRLKWAFPEENLIVAGYSHDVMCYIPSRRVLREGGYEAVESMIYYGQPGPFAESVEEKIVSAARRVMERVGGGETTPTALETAVAAAAPDVAVEPLGGAVSRASAPE
jgi:neutral ceramidase